MFEGSAARGAIASPLAAALYGLDIVAERIADATANETRFVVLARELHTAAGGNKGSIVLATEDRSGALAQALGAFADPPHQPVADRVEAHARPAARPTRS